MSHSFEIQWIDMGLLARLYLGVILSHIFSLFFASFASATVVLILFPFVPFHFTFLYARNADG